MTRKTLDQIVRSGDVTDVVLVKIEHPDGDVYLWDGIGDLDHDGSVWKGVGRLGSVQIAPSNTKVQVTDVTFMLSGVDAEYLSYLDQTVKGLRAWVWKAFLSHDYKVLFQELVSESELDQPSFSVEPNGQANMRIASNGGFYFLEPQSSAYSDVEEQRNFLTSLGEDPDSDTGFDLMSELKNTQINWEQPD